ncbi:hypothetical protein E2562_005611 [Oryza meyeriana var. granulata]|uniref:Uncharacterized protein n=1 Tax=Oryza meyeriana var. granulata TaxID=110450 RepID=A0A6G1F419_9ORYZ|nr:hypothetical protein E2562_005611 [Oryza meyeriana var. granulata]
MATAGEGTSTAHRAAFDSRAAQLNRDKLMLLERAVARAAVEGKKTVVAGKGKRPEAAGVREEEERPEIKGEGAAGDDRRGATTC